jgi:hypothetical protein
MRLVRREPHRCPEVIPTLLGELGIKSLFELHVAMFNEIIDLIAAQIEGTDIRHIHNSPVRPSSVIGREI